MRKIEQVCYNEEFRLEPDDGNLYYLMPADLMANRKVVIARDRHGREKQLPWGTMVNVLEKR